MANISASVFNNEMRLLRFSFNRIMKLRDFRDLREATQFSTGLTGIAAKFDSYANVDEYLNDINLLVKNFGNHLTPDSPINDALDELFELCHRDVDSIRKCPECFENWAKDCNDYFTKVCSKPHLIIFAKIEGYPFWPAKVMRVNGNMVNVVFFGDHAQADINANDCIFYSKRHSIPTKESALAYALMELDEHIGAIEEKFGSFKPIGVSAQCIDPTMINNYLEQMFPGAFV